MRLISCGCHHGRVDLLDADTDWGTTPAVWSWNVKSSSVPANHHDWFRDILDVKCVNQGREMLVCAGARGRAIALIDVASRDVRFYAQVMGNLHSGDVLPDGNLLAVGSEKPTTEAQRGFISVISTQISGHDPAKPNCMIYPLQNAHGVVWDDKEKCIWAHESDVGCTLGNMVKFEYNGDKAKPELNEVMRHPISICNGHDLFPTADTTKLFLTDLGHIHVFDTAQFGTAQQLAVHPDAALAALTDIKGISELNGAFAYPYKDPALGWKADTVVFYEPTKAKTFTRTLPKAPENYFYKARWWPTALPTS